LSQLMLQDAFTKLDGFKIRSAHVPGQPDVAYELPAQSPQNVISNMIVWFLKYFRGSQPVGSRVAVGFGQLAGLGVPERISLGMATR